ncbi:DUF2859 domain-containing protein, partial [Klebsiella pneumoniae]|uniref:DUF2859 domain-containing protein n=1 Tax=Klebsiella pneumoniae TaxID=573 RepID=UPI00272FDB58
PDHPFDEATMLPVRSASLSPGDVARRVIQAPGLTPLFLVGDDAEENCTDSWLQSRRSRRWLSLPS